MKQSLMFIPTLRDIPAGAEIASHKILLKGGYIKQHAAGVYTYLPLAYKVIKKVENIIREEMDYAGGLEILSSALQPKELWEESGRWAKYGPELIRFKDRHDREFCLGPTHEEIFTDLIRTSVKSYKYPDLLVTIEFSSFKKDNRPFSNWYACLNSWANAPKSLPLSR